MKIKYLLLLLLFFAFSTNANANAIDSLFTKENVRNFLISKLSKDGIIFPIKCKEISWAPKEQLYIKEHTPYLDTVFKYKNPITNKVEIRVIPHDTDLHFTNFEKENDYDFNRIIQIIDNSSLNYHKVDINADGRTDMVVNAGIVIVVLDMGNYFEGHIFADNKDFTSRKHNSFEFKKFMLLPDGTYGMLLRHDNNSCKSVQHSHLKSDVIYITKAQKKINRGGLQIDTLYEISNTIDSIKEKIYETGSFRTIIEKFADTVDMKLFNTIDTIVYKFDGFANYNPNFKTLGISKIDYCYENPGHDITGFMFGVSYIEINKDGNCYLKYGDYNQCFHSILDYEKLNNLFNYISYINIKSFNDYYICENLFGGTGGIFTIHFNDGTVKEINIWSHYLPMELGYLGKLISDISWSLHWEDSNRSTDFVSPMDQTTVTKPYRTDLKNNSEECNCYY